MGTAKQSLDDFLGQAREGLVSDCTACGKCVEVCPVTPFTDLKAGDEPGVINGVLALLRDGTPMSGAAQDWASQCNGCGLCIPACPEAINPRRMLMLA
ncbi:MAG: (Fe-S)-binding protein, partial [Alphaproteobacteria bacterium]|nr:(Fe-S)-binding protein [Alphaproteobacteria bacterium]